MVDIKRTHRVLSHTRTHKQSIYPAIRQASCVIALEVWSNEMKVGVKFNLKRLIFFAFRREGCVGVLCRGAIEEGKKGAMRFLKASGKGDHSMLHKHLHFEGIVGK